MNTRYPKRVPQENRPFPKSTPEDELGHSVSRLRKFGRVINKQAENLGSFISKYTAPDNTPERNRKIGYLAPAAIAITAAYITGLTLNNPGEIEMPATVCSTDEECAEINPAFIEINPEDQQ